MENFAAGTPQGASLSAAAATPIAHVCANKSGQLFFLASCKKSQTKVDVTSSSVQFKACSLVSSGVTREVSDSTVCSNTPRKKENTIQKVPADTSSLYFCVGTDGTMYFRGTSEPTCAAGQFAVVIGPHNRPPEATNDAYSVEEDGALNVGLPGVLSNDTDPDSDRITAELDEGPERAASFTFNSDGSFSYTPEADFNGSDSFSYKAKDSHNGLSAAASVQISVTPVNDEPVANEDSASVEEDVAQVIDVLANDRGLGDGSINVTIDTQGAKGSASVNADDTVTYTPDSDASGSDSFVYEVCDGDGDCATATVTVTIDPTNDAPTLDLNGASEGTGSTAEFLEGSGPVALAPDGVVTDVDDEELASATVTLTNRPNGEDESLDADVGTTAITKSYDSSSGVLTLTGVASKADYEQVLRTVTYDNSAAPPDKTDRVVEFTINDGEADSAVATATVTVTPLNEPPVVDLNGGGAGTGHSATFTEDGPPVSIVDSTALTITDADVGDGIVSATVTLTNRPNGEAESLDVNVGASGITKSYDSSSGVLTLSGVASKADYEQVLRTTTYHNSSDTPDTAERSIEFVVNDGQDDSDAATSTVSVVVADDPSVASDDVATTEEDSAAAAIDVRANDTDPDSASVENIQSVTQPTNGTVVITNGGADLTYQPDPDYCNDPPGNNPDTFDYTLTGGSTATVAVSVTCVDDPPLANDDTRTVGEDSGATNFDVLSNDTDADGDPIEITEVSDPADGTAAVVEGSPDQVSYEPDPNYCNDPGDAPDETFTYTVNDGDTATVSVKVTCVDDPPVAVNDSATVLEDSGASAVAVLTNDTDIDDGPKSVASVTQPTNGTVAITGGGSGLTYQPKANYCNDPPGTSPDTFTYKLNGDSEATVSMKVTCVNDNPVADDETFNGANSAVGNTTLVVNDPTDGPPNETGPKKSITGDILDGDTDIDGPGPLAVQAGTFATQDGGSVTIETDGDFIFRPKAGTSCTQSDQFDYTLTDQNPGTAGTDTGTVTVAFNECVWYANSALGTNGTGTSSSPFNTLAASGGSGLAGAGGTGDSDDQDDYLFLFQGTYTGGLPLENGQRLFSQRHGLTVGSDTLFSAAGNNATISNSVGNALTLASGNTVQGIDLGSTPAANAALSGTSVGTATMNTTTSGSITNASGGGVDISGGTLSMAFVEIDSSGATNDGIRLDNATGTFTAGSGSSIQNAGGQDVDLSGGSVNFTYDGTISDSSGTVVSVANQTGGTKDFNGLITSTGGGISLVSNSGATNRFDGGLTLSSGAANAFSAAGGGTVVVTDPAATDNTIATTTGTALNVANTTIGASGLTFRSISANGAPNGIVLNTTGTTAGTHGGLTVTGTGTTDGSGGTIQNITNRGSSFISARDISLSNMTFTNVGTVNGADPTNPTGTCGGLQSGTNTACNAGLHADGVTNLTLTNVDLSGGGQQGINGNNVTNFTFSNSNVTGFGNQVNEDGVRINNLLGTSTWNNVHLFLNNEFQAYIQNESGTGSLTVTNSEFNHNCTNCTSSVDGLQYSGQGTANMTLSVSNSNFHDLASGALQSDTQGSATMDITIQTSTFTNFGSNIITIAKGGSGNISFDILNNTIRGAGQNPSGTGAGININKGYPSADTSLFQGTISGNTIGDIEAPGGPDTDDKGSGVRIIGISKGTLTVSLTNNTINDFRERGIYAQMSEDSPSALPVVTGTNRMNLNITNNTINNPEVVSEHAILAQAGALGGDAGAMCANITGNNAFSAGGNGIRVRATQSTTLRLPGYVGPTTGTPIAVAETFVATNNPATTDTISVATLGSGTIVGGAACATP